MLTANGRPPHVASASEASFSSHPSRSPRASAAESPPSRCSFTPPDLSKSAVRVVMRTTEPPAVACGRVNSPLRGGSSPLRGGSSPLRGGNSPLRGGNSRVRGRSSLLRGWNLPLRGGNSPLRGRNSPLRGRNSPLR
eukprot:7119359-Pyramimonas_sp.AAC.2